MRLHVLQHVPFEGPGEIAHWAYDKGHTLERTLLYQPHTLPDLSTFDWLIVMGGPMSVADEAVYLWLAQEKELIKRVIGEGKHVLGVCLGAQLIAHALGARVVKNTQKEIGWFPIQMTDAGLRSPFFKNMYSHLKPLHWHGETFEIPNGCENLATSPYCTHQAFSFERHVLALQFHLEFSLEGLTSLVDHCEPELETSPSVQSLQTLLDIPMIQNANKALYQLLDAMETLSSCRSS